MYIKNKLSNFLEIYLVIKALKKKAIYLAVFIKIFIILKLIKVF